MKSLRIRVILVAVCIAAGICPLISQTPEQLYQKGNERIEEKGDEEATQLQKANFPKLKQPRLDRIGAALSRGPSPDNAFLGKEDASTDQLINGETLIFTRGTQPFLHNVLQYLKTAGKSLVTGGILAIFMIYFLFMLIIHLRVSHTNMREWKFVL
jgi:hypothetical protein